MIRLIAQRKPPEPTSVYLSSRTGRQILEELTILVVQEQTVHFRSTKTPLNNHFGTIQAGIFRLALDPWVVN